MKNGVFSVRCRHPGCPFNTQIKIETNLMGTTEQDVALETKKLAWDMATTKHDAVYSTSHYPEKPDSHKVAVIYEPLGY